MCESFILFGDPELWPSIGLSGLQGPGRERGKREKERSAVRDLVISTSETLWLYKIVDVC